MLLRSLSSALLLNDSFVPSDYVSLFVSHKKSNTNLVLNYFQVFNIFSITAFHFLRDMYDGVHTRW